MFDDVLTPPLDFEHRFWKSYLNSCVQNLQFQVGKITQFLRKINQTWWHSSFPLSFLYLDSHFLYPSCSLTLIYQGKDKVSFCLLFADVSFTQFWKITFSFSKNNTKIFFPFVQCNVYWFCPYSVLIQPWWMNLSW